MAELYSVPIGQFSALIAHNICKKLFPHLVSEDDNKETFDRILARRTKKNVPTPYATGSAHRSRTKVMPRKTKRESFSLLHSYESHHHQNYSKIQLVKDVNMMDQIEELFSVFQHLDQSMVLEIMQRHPNQISAFDVIHSIVKSGMEHFHISETRQANSSVHLNFEDRNVWPELVSLFDDQSTSAESCWEIVSNAGSDFSSDFSVVDADEHDGTGMPGTWHEGRLLQTDAAVEEGQTGGENEDTSWDLSIASPPCVTLPRITDESTSPPAGVSSYAERTKCSLLSEASVQTTNEKGKQSTSAIRTKIRDRLYQNRSLLKDRYPHIHPLLRRKISKAFQHRCLNCFSDSHASLECTATKDEIIVCEDCSLAHGHFVPDEHYGCRLFNKAEIFELKHGSGDCALTGDCGDIITPAGQGNICAHGRPKAKFSAKELKHKVIMANNRQKHRELAAC